MKELDLFNVQEKRRGIEQQSPNKKRDFIKRDSNQQIILYVYMGKKGI